MGEPKGYSEKAAERILKGFKERGWNFYKNDEEGNPEDNIRNNLAESLKMDVPYVLLPETKDPKDPEQVFEALETLAIKLDRKMPAIRIGGIPYELSGLTLNKDDVKLHSPDGEHVSYQELMDAIGTYVMAK